MGSRGPRPLPREVRKVRGTLRPDRDPPNPPKAAPGEPAMPRHLDPCARAKWRELVPLLLDMGVLTLADRTSLEMLCLAYSEYRGAAETIRREGLVLRSKRLVKLGGEEQLVEVLKPHPARAARDGAWGRYVAMMREFGLSPSARARVDLGAPVPTPAAPAGSPPESPSRLPDDDFERYLNGN